MHDFTGDIKKYTSNLASTVKLMQPDEVNKALNIIASAYEDEKTIFIMGNGGSASTASHIACDINKGISFGKKKRFKMICLNDNIPTMLAYANDVSYDDIFVEQLKNFLKPEDVVIGISGSGNSTNILKAIEYANQSGAVSVGICGYDGGKLKKTAKYSIHVDINDMQIVEDIHLVIGHIIMRTCEKVVT